MELRQFVSTTLVEIAQGVMDANAVLALEVGPIQHGPTFRDPYRLHGGRDAGVEFDVALTVSSSAGSSTVGGLQVVALGMLRGGAGADANERTAEEQVSRVRFQVTFARHVSDRQASG